MNYKISQVPSTVIIQVMKRILGLFPWYIVEMFSSKSKYDFSVLN